MTISLALPKGGCKGEEISLIGKKIIMPSQVINPKRQMYEESSMIV